MLKKIFINNLIALLAYGVSTELIFIFILFVDTISLTLCFAFIIYVFCGLFLKPMQKCSFLSVVLIAFILVASLGFSMFLDAKGGTFFYFFINPIAGTTVELDFFTPLQTIALLLSPIIPSLLLYLGMVIRKLVIRRRLLKASLEEQPHGTV